MRGLKGALIILWFQRKKDNSFEKLKTTEIRSFGIPARKDIVS